MKLRPSDPVTVDDPAPCNATARPARFPIRPPRAGALRALLAVAAVAVASCGEGSDPAAPGAGEEPGEPEPILSVAPSDVTLKGVAGAPDPAMSTISVTNAGEGALDGLSVTETYEAASASGWLTATLDATSAPAVLTVAASAEGLTEGAYQATVMVASGNATNGNQPVTVAFTVSAPLPDLAVTDQLRVEPAVAQPGAETTVKNITISNQGDARAESFRWTVLLSPDATITTDDVVLAEAAHPPISAGKKASHAPTVTIPADTPPGEYYVGVLADSEDAIDEVNEANNVASVPFTVADPASDPVLQLSSTSVDFQAIEGGADPGDRSILVVNAGGGTLGTLDADVDYFARPPQSWLGVTFRSEDLLVLSVSTGTLVAGTHEAVVEVTSTTAANSPRTIDVTLTVLPHRLPDLVAVDLEITPSTGSVVAGDEVVVTSFSLQNQGTADAEVVNNGFYLSTDAVITTADTRLSGNSFSFIAAGSAATVQETTVEIPAETSGGFYYLGFLADESGTIEEADESNNHGSVPLTVAEPVPDGHTLTVEKNIGSAGSVIADPPGPTHPDGTVVELTAVPVEGFTFSHWSGDASGQTNPAQVTMNGDRLVTAVFELVAPTLSASSVSSGSFTLTFAFPWPCPEFCLGSSQDRYVLEESTTSPTSGFGVLTSTFGRTSPESVDLTRSPGTYYYRVRAVDDANYGASPYSPAVTVTVEEEQTTATTLRIINDLTGEVAGVNDWGRLNTIIRVRIGSTESGVINFTGDAQELLHPIDFTSSVADLVDIQPGEEMTIDIPPFEAGYYLFIQTGWWEYVAFSNLWEKHVAVVVGCDMNEAYKWTAIEIVEPLGHPEIIQASEFLPQGNWYGSAYC